MQAAVPGRRDIRPRSRRTGPRVPPCSVRHTDSREPSQRCRSRSAVFLRRSIMSNGNGEVMSVKIVRNDKGSPNGKLADVEVIFEAGSGPFNGLRLLGFAI